MTFSGFSALITVLRQVSGGGLSRYDAFLVVNYFLIGFAIAVFCMLPPLLSGLSTNANIVWRAPSALGAVVGIAVELAALRRRRRSAEPAQRLVIALFLAYWPAFLLLIMSALNILVRPGFGPYAASLTWIFAIAGIDYIAGLHVLFRMHNVHL
jgi:hypothetical protein